VENPLTGVNGQEKDEQTGWILYETTGTKKMKTNNNAANAMPRRSVQEADR
jgi:hypothetical protein